MAAYTSMWEYQPHFRASAQTATEEIFRSLDPNLSPRLVLVGFSVFDGTPNIEPVDTVYNRHAFAPAAEFLAREGWQDAEENALRRFLTHLGKHDRATSGHMFRNLLLDLLAEIDRRTESISFSSYPIRIGSYIVVVLLQLHRPTYLSYSWDESPQGYSLETTHSFLNAAILEYLNACSFTLTDPQPGSGVVIFGREPAEIIRSAANHLMYKLTYLTRQWGYPISLYEACNAISALKYEGHEGIGTMVIADADHDAVELIVELRSRVSLNDHRGTRKLLEMATEQMSLLSDAGYIYGLGRYTELGNARGVVRVDFTGHYDWQVVHGGRLLMRVVYGQPQLPSRPINEKSFRSAVERLFRGITESEVERLWSIALEASRQKRGTILVFSTGAKFEAQRLRNQCIQTKPLVPTPDVIGTITSIDGAVLLSPDGTCHAIGVILDGLASSRGNPMRGSRYNSAVRYVETTKRQFGYSSYAVVVSEDGMVDLIPELLPPIAKSEIEEHLERLRVLAHSDDLDQGEFYRTMEWLNRHRSYLMAEIVRELNELLVTIQPRLGDESVAWQPFSVDPNIDESSLINV